MGRRAVPAKQAEERAAAKGYAFGKHREKDSTRDKRRCGGTTLEHQNKALKQYEDWLDTYNVAEAPRPVKGSTAPDLATIKDFIRFHVAAGTGTIDKEGRLTVDSTNTFAEWFFAGFARVTGNAIDEEDRSGVYDWVRNDLKEEGVVVNIKRPKHLFGEEEMIRFNTTFWAVDDAKFIHPRNKIQIPFLFSLFSWTGARIGAFFPDGKPEGNGGLRYKDIELVLQRVPCGGWKVIYRVDQRWVKNNRDPENTVYGASTSQHGELLKDDTKFLLSLALTDEAIHGIACAEDLWELRIPPGDDVLPLRWADGIDDLPIFRNATPDNGVTEEPLSKYMFDSIVKSVLKLSGFFGDVTIHAIRRYLGKRIDERYTEVERSQHLTQADRRIFGDAYVANTSSVEGRSAFYKEPAEHGHVDYFQSCGKFREKGLPASLPAAEEAAIRQDPRVLDLEGEVQRLQIDCAPPSAIKAAKDKLRACYNKLKKNRYKQYKLEWVRERRDWKVENRGIEQADDQQNADLLEILSSALPYRGRLRTTMISNEKISEERRRQAVEDLCTLATEDCTTFYRPRERPVDGVCPVDGCAIGIMSLPKRQRSTHINRCRRKDLASTLERSPSELEYCYACFDWFVAEEWDKHCETHLASITSKLCASITYCYTLVRPALCPFCIGDTTLDASSRWRSWTREDKLRDHLRSHLDASRWPLKCPHPLCSLQLDDETSFWYHLSDVHGLRTKTRVKKCPREERDPPPFIIWTPGTASQKRKRQEADDQGQPRPPKRGERSLTPLRRPLDRKAPAVHTSPSRRSPEASFTGTAVEDDPQGLPELTHSGATSPPDDEPNLRDDLSLFEDFRLPGPNEPQWSIDSPATGVDGYNLPSPGEEALFSLYLRSPSPPCSSVNGTGDGTKNDDGVASRTVDPRDICLSPEEEPCLTDSTGHDITAPKEVPIEARKSRIKLRLSQPKPQAKLRLSQPKRTPAHKSRRRR